MVLVTTAACNPYTTSLPDPLCRTTVDCPKGLGCDEDGRCRRIGRLDVEVTFGPGAALGRDSPVARLALLPARGLPEAGADAVITELEMPVPREPRTARLALGELPLGPFLAMLIVDAPPAMDPDRIDVCPEDVFGYTHLRIGRTGSRALGSEPGAPGATIAVVHPGADTLCMRRR